MAQPLDFRTLFQSLASPYMVLDRAFRFVDVNEAYLKVTDRSREELIGGVLFDLFPNEGEGERLLRASLERVLATGRRDSIAYIPYPIAKRGGGLEMHYWSAVHTPLLDADGQVAHIVQNTVNVTELHRLKTLAFGPGADPTQASLAETQLLQRAQEVQRANASLLMEMDRLRDLFMQAPGFVAVLTAPDLSFIFVNRAYQALIGDRQVIGRRVAEALPEVEGQGYLELLPRVIASREPFVGAAMSLRLRRGPNRVLEERFVDFVFQPILAADGACIGIFVQGSDVTDRIKAEAQQKLLVDELNHRVKNTLATVQSIAAQTLRTRRDPAEFREAFESRLLALSATHDLLTASNWSGASLREVLTVEFRPYDQDRYTFAGPDVALTPAQVLNLGLLFHELATNAAKYGALSQSGGCVRLSWTVQDGRLELLWQEEGGPAVARPVKQGFGSRLIERSLQGELRGQARLEFAPEGLRCRIGLPLAGAG